MNEDIHTLIELNRTIHEPARLMIMVVLAAVEEADFLYLLNITKLTKGNLSSHLSKLEEAGYVTIDKSFVGKVPRTVGRITAAGQQALEAYRVQMRQVVG